MTKNSTRGGIENRIPFTQIKAPLCLAVLTSIVITASAADPPTSAKATYLIGGMHCPPCTRTVERSLAAAPGVQSVTVDWKAKSAKVQFDPEKTSAQRIADRITATPHMMGGKMKYAGWLALSVPGMQDETAAGKVKRALTDLKGVGDVTTYPRQHMLAVRFNGLGDVTVDQLIATLAEIGFEAKTY